MRSEVRWHQSAQSAEGLARSVDAWAQAWSKHDFNKQYVTQVSTIVVLLNAALKALRTEFSGVGFADPRTTYEACRRFDLRIVALAGVFDFFRRKFDQRLDKAAGGTIRAADEVVWSMHASAFNAVRVRQPSFALPPAPLPYIEPAYGLDIHTRGALPGPIRALVPDVEFRRLIQGVPVPVVRLPPDCVEHPWSLLLLAHEMGHHLERELPEAPSLGVALTARIDSELKTIGAPEARRRVWRPWTAEVLADIVSVLFSGAWAIVGLLELVFGPRAEMAVADGRYPPAMVRLGLMHVVASRLGLDTSVALDGYDPIAEVRGEPSLCGYLAELEVVATAALGTFDGFGRLEQICGLNSGRFAKAGEIAAWKERLVFEPRALGTGVGAAREITCATRWAWAELSSTTKQPEELAVRGADLGRRMLAHIAANSPSGERASSARHTKAEIAASGVRIAEALLGSEPTRALEEGE
jgi:hypothetical protein